MFFYFHSLLLSWSFSPFFFKTNACFCQLYIYNFSIISVGIWCQKDVVSTSIQRNYVASTLIWRHFYVMCPLGYNKPTTRVSLSQFSLPYYMHFTIPNNAFRINLEFQIPSMNKSVRRHNIEMTFNRRRNDLLTSMLRHYVSSTSVRRR